MCMCVCVCVRVCVRACRGYDYIRHVRVCARIDTRVCAYPGVYRELAEDMICLKERAAFEARRLPEQAQALSPDDGTYASNQPVCVCAHTRYTYIHI